MFFEQYSHEPYIATSRFLLQHRPDTPERAALLASKRDGGRAALKVMEQHLAKNDFFVGDYTIATSPSSPTRTSPMKAAFRCTIFRRLGRGSSA
jgi:glutathione S-transferase